MAGPPTGELLNFQDYSPDNDRSARIDVEAIHTNHYNAPNLNPNYGYEEPKPVQEEPEQPKSNHNFWTIEYYQKYFNVQTTEVVDRIVSSIVPKKYSSNFFDEKIKGKPDLYGPIWIAVTLVNSALIFVVAVSGNIASYLQNVNKDIHWRYDFHLVSYAATAILCYTWMVPMALWASLKFSIDDSQLIEGQGVPSMISLFCMYGYSVSVYIPVAILWTIQVSWLQWLLVVMAAFDSGCSLVYWLLPALKKSRYRVLLMAMILGMHFLLAAGFMLCFFHVPDVEPALVPLMTTMSP